MTNVNADVTQLAPSGLATNAGQKIGIMASTAKAAQNDTITITNGDSIDDADLRIVATGVAEPYTISGNVLTLTSVTTGNVRGIIYFRKGN